MSVVSSRARKILEEAYALDRADRALIAEELARSLGEEPEDVRSAWAKEAVRRLEQVEQGEVELVSHDDVRAHIQRLLDRAG